jgi:L-ribulose-5-phosphate 3-epimerase
MDKETSRRDFLKLSTAAAVTALGAVAPQLEPAAAAVTSPLKRGVLISMLPKDLSYADRFRMARDVGFEVIQAQTVSDQKEAEEIKRASEQAGIPIDSVENMGHWKYPLSSADPAVVQKSVEFMRTSLHNAKLWGAGAVLLVPAVVNPATSYDDAWRRSQKQIRTLIPLAMQLNVIIAVEEVWNKFLLSPLEMAHYLDEFNSPLVQSWFDVGNVVLYGYPQDWIRTLGHRINRLHVKDFKMHGNSYEWVNLGDGAVDWAAVRQALTAVAYKGPAICELPAGDETYLRDVSQRMDRLVRGA